MNDHDCYVNSHTATTLRSWIPQSYINHGHAITVSSQSLTFVCTQELVFLIIISSKQSSVVPIKLWVLICSLHCSVGQLRLGHNWLLLGWSGSDILSRWRSAEWPWRWRRRWWWWVWAWCRWRRRRGRAAWRWRGLGRPSATRRRWCNNCRWRRVSAATAARPSAPWCSLPGTRRPASAAITSARTAPTWGTTSTRCWRSATCWTRCRASTAPTAPPTSSSTSPPPPKPLRSSSVNIRCRWWH